MRANFIARFIMLCMFSVNYPQNKMKRVFIEFYEISEGVFCLVPGVLGQWLRRVNYKIWLGRLGVVFKIGRFSRIQQPKSVFISDGVTVNDFAWIAANPNGGDIQIGKNTLIGPRCVIHSGNHVFKDLAIPIRKQGHKFDSIVIGQDVWIASNVTILKGVHIGDGAVIAAGSIVINDVSSNTIVGGIPAKKIGDRGL